ncbi:MAG: TIGR02710 family CRISPR-associated protein [Ignavibacteriaceae bacterium]|nr:TIGR02710 family CRISPR-associated protein [Ignavibacteriaceae bacterium]
MDKTNQHKKVLIMTVGTGATGADIAHGLFFSIKDSNPDLLVLIGSQKSFETTLSHLRELINKEQIDCEVVENVIEEINDFEKLHFEYSNIIEELLKKGFALNKISVDYTSGTKAMSAALVSAALSAKVGSILYVYGERGESGRVKSGTERRSSLSPSKIFSKDIFNKAIDYFNSYRYCDCIELLENFEFHPDYDEKVKLLIKLSKIFDAWDKFNFNSAFEICRTISLDELKIYQLKGYFEDKLKPALVKLKSNELIIEKIIDLISNAQRRAAEGKYDDAVARLYRALEMLGQLEFQKEFNCSTGDIIIDKIPEKFREDVKAKYFDKKDHKIKIPLFGTFELLANIQNKIGLEFISMSDEIKQILSQRNNSILAHGFIPLKEKDYSAANQILEKFFTSVNITFNLISFPKIQ